MAESESGALSLLREGVLALASSLGTEPSVAVVCRSAVAHLSAAHRVESAVAVSVPQGPVLTQTIAAHGALARRIEEVQVTAGEGPSLEVAAGAGTILIGEFNDPKLHDRWPMFTPTAAQAGIRSLCVVPVRVGAARFGVFAVYLQRPGGLPPAALADAMRFAAITLDLLLSQANAMYPDGAGDPGPGAGFFDDRPEIHQATGMIAVQLGVDLATALLRLRARALADSRQLSGLAADVVARRLRFQPD